MHSAPVLRQQAGLRVRRAALCADVRTLGSVRPYVDLEDRLARERSSAVRAAVRSGSGVPVAMFAQRLGGAERCAAVLTAERFLLTVCP